MGDLLAQDVAEKGKEKEEPLHKKTKKSEGLTISNQCKPAEEERRTKSISDLAKAVNELGGDAPTEEAKVDDEVSKSQRRKKENLSRKTFHVPSHDGVRKVTKMTMKGHQKKKKQKREESGPHCKNDEDERSGDSELLPDIVVRPGALGPTCLGFWK